MIPLRDALAGEIQLAQRERCLGPGYCTPVKGAPPREALKILV